MFFKVGVLKNFGNFAKEHLCWNLFLKKLQAWRPSTLVKETPTKVFSCKISINFKNTLKNASTSCFWIQKKSSRDVLYKSNCENHGNIPTIHPF